MKPFKRVIIFLALVAFLLSSLSLTARAEPITRAEFVDLFVRVIKLDDRLPPDSDQLPPEKFYKAELSLLTVALGIDEFIGRPGSELLTRGEFASVLYDVVAEEPGELTQQEKIRFLIAKGIAIKDADPAEPIPREEIIAALNTPLLAPLEALAYEEPDAGAGPVSTDRASLSSDLSRTTGTQESSRTDATTDKSGEQDSQGPRARYADRDGDGVLDKDDYYPTNPLRASGTDTDGDGTDDEFDTDDDNDGLIDGYESLAWMDSNMQTNPLDADSDNDTILDVEDAFPWDYGDDDGDLTSDPDEYGSRDYVRGEVKEIIERNILRDDIFNMLAGIQIRQMDAVMEQITDAQTGKVLVDRKGYRVRVEQYVLRPDSYTVQLLNVNLRSGGSLAGLHTLDWTTTFPDNQSLDSLTAAELRDLPWGDYLESEVVKVDEEYVVTGGPNYGSTQPSYYPEIMTVKLENPQGDFLKEKREFSELTNDGTWLQTITNNQIYLNDGWRNFTIETNKDSGNGNPQGFNYDPKELDKKWNIKARFYVIGDGLSGLVGEMDSKRFDNMFDFLGVNIIDEERLNIGAYNLEIRLRSRLGAGGYKEADLIYIPWDRQYWDESHHW